MGTEGCATGGFAPYVVGRYDFGWRVERRQASPKWVDRLQTMLLQLDARAGLFQLSLELVGLVALDAFLDRLRRLVDEGLRLLQAEAGGGAHDLDHLDLLVARAGEDHVDGRGSLLGAGTVTSRSARGGRGRGGDRRRRHAELLLERLDALGQLEHRDALELVDPFLC